MRNIVNIVFKTDPDYASPNQIEGVFMSRVAARAKARELMNSGEWLDVEVKEYTVKGRKLNDNSYSST